MKNRTTYLLPLALMGLALSCTNQPNRYETSRNETTPPPTDQAAAPTTPTEPAATDPATTGSADNTAVNERDRNAGTVTPMDQAENSADRSITQDVRQAIVADKSLSMTAKNVKIVTANGVVTLRGPVNTESERMKIVDKAQQVAGVMRVDNQLEVVNQ